MKLHLIPMMLAAAISLGTLSSCIDDNYDLSDIDSDAELKVESLTLPVNIDEIYLKSVIDTTGSDIVIIDGTYAIEQKGSFNSDEIKVKPITLKAPTINDSHRTIPTTGADQLLELTGQCSFPITVTQAELNYENDNVGDEIVAVTEVGVRFDVKISIGFPTLDNVIRKLTYKDLVIQLPKGLTIAPGSIDGTYDAETGLLRLNNMNVQGTELTLSLPVTGIDRRSGIIFENHKIYYNDHLSIVSGEIVINSKDLAGTGVKLPSSVEQVTRYTVSDIDVTSFSGTIQYSIAGFDIPDVDLSSLPKVLAQNATDITLVNPQIYLRVNNPVARFRVNASTGLSITPYRGNTASPSCDLPAGSIEIPYEKGANDIITFCLSPQKPDSYLAGFSDATFIPYTALSNVLAGQGLPSRLRIDLLSPQLPMQTVTDFPVGSTLGTVEGSYNFFTPLALGEGSSIIYTEEETGWGSEDLDKLTITSLHVTARVSTDVPFGVTFSGYPVDNKGNRIGNVEIKGAEIKAKATDEPLDIYITGEIKNLDGIVFTAVATQQTQGALTEGLKLKLSDIKATASGYYKTTL